MNRMWNVLTRRKVLEPSECGGDSTKLARVLNTYDLTALGVGSTLGVGVYVLAGHVAKESAGPSVILSFLIAAIASVFAGLCYAEFGARAPRAGSAYIYSYVSVGEFVAFVIGWNLILEYVIGSASVARGLTLYVDSLVNDTLKNAFIEIAPINLEHMSGYFDFCSCGISILLAVGLAFGVKKSSLVNNIFTVLNIGVVLFVIIAGSIKANTDNWYVPANPSDSKIGEGGFFPFGIEGMIKGAATCFYGFIGFDCIATTGEEVKNPQRAIPLSIILSLTIIFLSYFGISTVVTLMVPYYMQDENAPIPSAFEEIGWDWAKWVVAIGGIFGLCASLFGAMFPLPRIIYAMATDGLVFKFLGRINKTFSTPVIGTLLAGLLTGLMAALFELKQLINMMSIGTLLAYTIVAACVLLLRYGEDKEDYILIRRYSSSSDADAMIYRDYDGGLSLTTKEAINDSEEYDYPTDRFTIGGFMNQYFNFSRSKSPTKLSETIVNVNVISYSISCLLVGLCIMYLKDDIADGTIWAIVITSIILFFMLLTIFSIWLQPTSNRILSFKVPLVPLIPALSIFINIYLMLMLDVNTWIRFGVWMIIGLLIYFFSVKAYSWEPYVIHLAYKESQISNGKMYNGHTNIGFIANEESFEEVDELPGMHEIQLKQRKSRAPIPPIDRKSSIDLILEPFDNLLNLELNRQFSVDTEASSMFDPDTPVAETVTVTAVVHDFKPTLNIDQKLEARYSQATNDKCIVTAIRNSQELVNTVSDDEIIFDVKKFESNTIDEQPIHDSGTASIEYKETECEPTIDTSSEFIDSDATTPTTIEASNGSFNIELEENISSDNNSYSEKDIVATAELVSPLNEDILYTNAEPDNNNNEAEPIKQIVQDNNKSGDLIPPPPQPIPVPPPFIPLFTSRKSVKKSMDNPLDKFNTLSTLPPVAPPMEGFKTMPKKPSFRQTSMETMFSQIRENKSALRKTSPKPLSRKDSLKDEFVDVEEVDDNIKFGSKQHDKIRKTLGQLYSKGTEMLIRKNTYVMPMAPFHIKPSTDIPQLKIHDDGSIDAVPTEDIKKMLSKFLDDRNSAPTFKSSSQSSPLSERSTTNSQNENKTAVSTEVTDEYTKHEHASQMRNTLTAINKGLVSDLKKTFSKDT